MKRLKGLPKEPKSKYELIQFSSLFFRAWRKTEAALETFERGCKNILKKYTHPKEVDQGAKNTVENEMKTCEYG